MWDTPIYRALRVNHSEGLFEEEEEMEVEVRVVAVEGDYDEWFHLAGIPREGEWFSTGETPESTYRISAIYWLPLGSEDNTNSHVLIELDNRTRGKSKKEPHPWKK